MHVRVRLFGKPDTIVVVESKLTKIEQFRRLVRDKFDVPPQLQRLLYGGKLLEDGYTFHDYNIKLNDVIQLMIKSQIKYDNKKDDKKLASITDNESKDLYKDAKSQLYEVGDLVDLKDKEQGAWFEGKVIRIVQDPKLSLKQSGIQEENNSNAENIAPGSSDPISKNDPSNTNRKKKGITDFFSTISDHIQNNPNVNTDIGLLYKIQLDDDEEDAETEHYSKLNQIRPRARNVIEINDLKVGQTVMVNHNTESISEKGYWYDFKVCEIIKTRKRWELNGTLYLGPYAVPKNDTRVKVHDKIFAIEQVVPISKRSEELKKLMLTQPDKRSLPLTCLRCRDDEESKCKDCGCFLCSGKQQPNKIILCDECNNGYHMFCLTPPITELPDEDWYCPSCKRNPHDVVAPGASKQTKKSAISKSNRDWGRGMACAGKTKTCAMPPNHFGPIPGIEVGMMWRFRIQLSESGVHRPPVSGIHGRDVEGAYSIVLSGGYEDDVDYGNEFTYTGSGGRDLSGNKRTAEQSCDQTLTRENKALARNCAVKDIKEEGADAGDNWRNGKPVRVVRSYKMLKHFPQFAPKEGIRYDGIYKVVKYYPEKGKSGFKVWKYLLRRDDPNAAPWESGAKQFQVVYPDGYLEAEAEKRAQKQKSSGKGKSTKKRVLLENNSITDDNNEGEDSFNGKSPPPKKRKTRSMTDVLKSPITKVTKQSPNKSIEKPKINKHFTTIKKGSPKQNKKQEENSKMTLTTEELDAINADTLNAKLWDECLEICKFNGKAHFIEHVTQVFLCIICQEMAAGPVTTHCLHNFCMVCLKLAFKSTDSHNCPCCRRDLSKYEMCYNDKLKSALRIIMPGYDAGKK